METFDILKELLGWLVGGGIAAIAFWRQNKRLKNAEASKAEAEAKLADLSIKEAEAKHYEERFESLHTTISNHNKTEEVQSKRILDLEKQAVDERARSRELSDRLYKSERELNVQNERITTLTEERDEERRLKEYYKRWRCTKSICEDPEGRRPPNSTLAAEEYVDPE